MEIVLVAAMDRNRLIGRSGGLPWHLPRDLKHFKEVTLGRTVVMGRRTFESLGKPLRGRTNIVLTRSSSFTAEGCRIARTPEEAIQLAGDEPELMVLGGAEVYAAFLPLATKLELTLVDAKLEGDTHFPAFNPADWDLVRREEHPPDDRNAHPMAFCTYVRRPRA